MRHQKASKTWPAKFPFDGVNEIREVYENEHQFSYGRSAGACEVLAMRPYVSDRTLTLIICAMWKYNDKYWYPKEPPFFNVTWQSKFTQDEINFINEELYGERNNLAYVPFAYKKKFFWNPDYEPTPTDLASIKPLYTFDGILITKIIKRIIPDPSEFDPLLFLTWEDEMKHARHSLQLLKAALKHRNDGLEDWENNGKVNNKAHIDMRNSIHWACKRLEKLIEMALGEREKARVAFPEKFKTAMQKMTQKLQCNQIQNLRELEGKQRTHEAIQKIIQNTEKAAEITSEWQSRLQHMAQNITTMLHTFEQHLTRERERLQQAERERIAKEAQDLIDQEERDAETRAIEEQRAEDERIARELEEYNRTWKETETDTYEREFEKMTSPQKHTWLRKEAKEIGAEYKKVVGPDKPVAGGKQKKQRLNPKEMAQMNKKLTTINARKDVVNKRIKSGFSSEFVNEIRRHMQGADVYTASHECTMGPLEKNIRDRMTPSAATVMGSMQQHLGGTGMMYGGRSSNHPGRSLESPQYQSLESRIEQLSVERGTILHELNSADNGGLLNDQQKKQKSDYLKTLEEKIRDLRGQLLTRRHAEFNQVSAEQEQLKQFLQALNFSYSADDMNEEQKEQISRMTSHLNFLQHKIEVLWDQIQTQQHANGSGMYAGTHQCTSGTLSDNLAAGPPEEDPTIPNSEPLPHPRPSVEELEHRLENLYEERASISYAQLFASIRDPSIENPSTLAEQLASSHTSAFLDESWDALANIDATIQDLEQQLYVIRNAERVEAERKYKYTPRYLRQLQEQRRLWYDFYEKNPYSFVEMGKKIADIDQEIANYHLAHAAAP